MTAADWGRLAVATILYMALMLPFWRLIVWCMDRQDPRYKEARVALESEQAGNTITKGEPQMPTNILFSKTLIVMVLIVAAMSACNDPIGPVNEGQQPCTGTDPKPMYCPKAPTIK